MTAEEMRADDAREKTAAELLGDGWLIPLDQRANAPQALELATPVRHGGQELRTVTVGVLKGKHVRQAPSSWERHDDLMKVAGLLTMLPDSVIDQLEGGDLVGVIDATLRACWPLLELPSVGVLLEGEARRPWPVFPAPFTLPLEKRARVGAEALSSLTFRAITGKLVRRFPNHLETRHLPKLIEGLTGVAPELFDELEGIDLSRALGVAQCFFAATRPTTRKPSGN